VRPRWRDVRMLMPALLGWGTCALGISLRPSPWVAIGFLVCAIALALTGWRLGRQGFATWVTPVLIVSVMLGAVVLGSVHREQAALAEAAQSTVELEVRLTQSAMPGGQSVRAHIVTVSGAPLSHGGVPARIIGDVGPGRHALGATTTLTGFLMEAKPWEQQSWVVLVRKPPTQWTPPGTFLADTDSLRADFMTRSLARPGDAGALLPGLAIGDTTAVDPGLVEAMRITSLSHLVAVSGANCAIVVALVVGVVALLGGGIWLRMIAGVLALVGFVVLVTPEPSIIRASIMASIVLVFLASSRPVRGIPVLGVTVLVLLAIDPWLATDFAFALSVLATGGILLLTGPLVRILSRYLPTGLALVIALPLAAQIACQPVLILLNPIIPSWAIVANALAAPAAPIATVVGMLACVLGPLAPGLAQGLLWLAWWPAEYIAAIGRVLADTPYSSWPWPSGWWGAVAVAVIGYGAITLFLLPPPRPRGAVIGLTSLTVVTVLAVLVAFVMPRAIVRHSIPSDWTLAQCDVGQGDAVLLRSEGRVALIDTGRYPTMLKECLFLLGVAHLDLLVITHFDDDHVGAWGVVGSLKPEVWVGVTPDVRKDRFVNEFLEAGLTVTEVSSGDTHRLGSYELLVLWPTRQPLAKEGNDSSIVVELRPDGDCRTCVSALLLGDLGEQPQRILQAHAQLERMDVIKVSHHGSSDQHHGLYRALASTVALIGVGADNSYGHPTANLLSVLFEDSEILRSDQVGTVTLHKNEAGDIVVWSEH